MRVWELVGAPERLTVDLDATLITAHSEKDQAAGTFKSGYGCSPMRTRPVRRCFGQLRPRNAGANNAADQIAVAEQAIAQIPGEHLETIELLLRVDSAGASGRPCRVPDRTHRADEDRWPSRAGVMVRSDEPKVGTLYGAPFERGLAYVRETRREYGDDEGLVVVPTAS